ncbi:ABC transporter ATP-binding protein [Nocardioides sp. LHG3406-4]|uniref:ABC transporter ATP-binding protein n=1 Tax=Nocardioides sp. LHG3406-4 TaxID=2804575 RepID=UPI003CE79C07
MTNDIVIDSVSQRYVNIETGRETVALDAISVELRARSFTSIIGPSGCGKSTLLRILAGLLHPTHGHVSTDGEVITGPSPEIGFVFQEPSLYPWRDIISNVAFGLELQGVARKERLATAAEFIELVGLKGWERAYPRELSGGMQQRAAIARALAMRPPILLLDEPFGALDEQTRLILGSELLRIWEATSATVVLVTHSIQEAVLLSDQVVLMSGRPGRIKNIYDVPLTRPRDDRTIADAAFQQLHSELWGSLRDDAYAADRALTKA